MYKLYNLKFSQRTLSAIVISLCLALLAPSFGLAAGPPVAPDLKRADFIFVHITDTHVGSSAGNRNTPRVVDELLKLDPRPAFVVNGGDLTELGTADQYEDYRQLMAPIKFPIYNTLGNHDGRWSDIGKGLYAARFGQPYYSFDYRGIHFVVLDTSVNAEAHGHLERSMLDWLGRDLRRVGAERPVLVFSHHPIAYEPDRFIDNDADFLAVIRPFNVRAVFTGHGHLNLEWNRNGVRYFMTQAAMDGGYKVIAVRNNALEIYNRGANGALEAAATVPLSRSSSEAGIKIEVPAFGAPVAEVPAGGEIALRVRPSGSRALMASMEYRIDSGAWSPLAKPGIPASGVVSVSEVPPGYHKLNVRGIDAGGVYTDQVEFQIKGGPASILWRFPTAGGIQGTPAVSIQSTPAIGEGRVYVGSNDGRLYAIKSASGEKAWEFPTGGPVMSSPSLYDGAVYFGSGDGKVYALDAQSGRLKWSFAAKGPVMGSPLVIGGRVYVGSSDHNLYALDAGTGSLLWTFKAGDVIRTRPAYGNGAVYFGAWDGNLYAVDAGTGKQLWYTSPASSIYFSPANGSVLYYRGRIFATTPNDSRVGGYGLRAYDAVTGKLLWGSKESFGYSTPAILDGSVVVATLSGTVFAFDPATGEKRWSLGASTSTYDSSPVPFGEDLAFGGLYGRLVSVNGRIGRVNWRLSLGDNLIFGNAATAGGNVSGGVLYIGSMDGNLYAVAATPNPLPRSAISFRDTAGHWAEAEISQAAALKLLQGYGPGEFKPDRLLTRAELAVVLARYLGLSKPGANFKSKFRDIEKHWARDAISALEEQGVVQGARGADGSVSFRPDEPIARGEAAAMIARLLGLKDPHAGFAGKLADIRGYWGKDYILALEDRGIVKGSPQGDRLYFRPTSPVSRAEAAVMVLRMASA